MNGRCDTGTSSVENDRKEILSSTDMKKDNGAFWRGEGRLSMPTAKNAEQAIRGEWNEEMQHGQG